MKILKTLKAMLLGVALLGATSIGYAQTTVTLAITCGSTTTTSTLLTTWSDPCVSIPGNVSIMACHSCAAQLANSNASQKEVRLTAPNQDPGGTGDISVGVPGSGNFTINPISSGVPDGTYDIWVEDPCWPGELIKCGTLKISNC
jgi:hypothetical protein